MQAQVLSQNANCPPKEPVLKKGFGHCAPCRIFFMPEPSGGCFLYVCAKSNVMLNLCLYMYQRFKGKTLKQVQGDLGNKFQGDEDN